MLYTIVGIYKDSMQGFIHIIEAESVEDAKGQIEEQYHSVGPMIIAIFKKSQKNLLQPI